MNANPVASSGDRQSLSERLIFAVATIGKRRLRDFPSGDDLRNMRRFRFGLLALLALWLVPCAMAQRQLEKLGRGVVAIRQSSTQVYVGWRLLGTDPDDTRFNLYRVT